jgi:hypothetical protein
MYNARQTFRWMKLMGLLLLAGGCRERYEQLAGAIKTIDQQGLAAGNYVVIPNEGCDGCISTAEDFVKKHYATNDHVRYIFTRIQSVKLLRVKLGSEVMSGTTVLLDTANIIVYPDKAKVIYPMIVRVSDGHITDIDYQSPESDGLATLLKVSR